jgi:hypothetical protein
VKDEPCLMQFAGKACHLHSSSSYAPHLNLLLYHEQVTRAKRLKMNTSIPLHDDSTTESGESSSAPVPRTPPSTHMTRQRSVTTFSRNLPARHILLQTGPRSSTNALSRTKYIVSGIDLGTLGVSPCEGDRYGSPVVAR